MKPMLENMSNKVFHIKAGVKIAGIHSDISVETSAAIESHCTRICSHLIR
jgi:hypothetical protein